MNHIFRVLIAVLVLVALVGADTSADKAGARRRIYGNNLQLKMEPDVLCEEAVCQRKCAMHMCVGSECTKQSNTCSCSYCY